jgi:hypothetical protein
MGGAIVGSVSPGPSADKQRVTGANRMPVPTTDVVPLVRCKADAVRRSADSTLPHRQSAVLNRNRNASSEPTITSQVAR